MDRGTWCRRLRQLCLLALLCCLCQLSHHVSAARGETMYDILKNNPANKILMAAIDADEDGSLRNLLQMRNMPITALVPTSGALISAAVKFGTVRSVADIKGLLGNSCLVNALLKQHVIPGQYTYRQLSSVLFKPSYLVTNRRDIKVNWPIMFRKEKRGSPLVVSSAAWNQETNEPIVNGTIVEPYDVRVGSGIMHTINQLLLPTSNLTQLLEITGCGTS